MRLQGQLSSSRWVADLSDTSESKPEWLFYDRCSRSVLSYEYVWNDRKKNLEVVNPPVALRDKTARGLWEGILKASVVHPFSFLTVAG